MNIPNESYLSRKKRDYLGRKLRQCYVKQKGVVVGDILYYATFLNLFASVGIVLISNGVIELETPSVYIRLLAISDFVILSFVVLNYRFLSRLPSFVALVLIWIFWMVTTCLLLLRYDTSVAVYGLVKVLYSPLLFLFFFVSLKQNPALLRTTNIFFLLLLAFIVPFFLSEVNYKNALLVDSFSVLNDIYYIILLLPWVLLYPKDRWRGAGIIIIVFLALWSMKRTALFALLLALGIYFFSERIRVRKLIEWRILVGICFFSVSILLLYSYIDTQTNGFFVSRISSSLDDKGSGRVDIYKEVIKLQGESTISSWFLGHGHDTVSKSTSSLLSAHNDWLEVLFDYGLVGLVLYSCFNLLLLRKIMQLFKQNSYYGPPMAASYVLFFLISLSSHLVIYASYFAYLMAFWGSLFAISGRENMFLPKDAQFTCILSK